MSAACAGFPAQMREESIRLCEAHLDLAADVAVKSYATAAAAAASFNPSTQPEKERNLSSRSPVEAYSVDPRHASEVGSLARMETDAAAGIARGAVLRAGCLVAAQGLLDPAIGPRAAGESLAMSVLSLWSAPELREEKHKEGGGEGLAGGSARPRQKGTVAVDGTPAFVTQETFDELGSIADGGDGRGGPRSVSVPANDRPVPAVSKNSVPLRDLRWGLELLLACVAPHLADEVDDIDRAESTPGTPTGQHSDGPIDEERRSVAAESSPDEPGMLTDVSSVTFDGGSVKDGTAATGSEGGGGSGPPKNEVRSDVRPLGEGDGGGASTACRLVDFACRHPDMGPALVASVLISWIPQLADWGSRPAMKAENGRKGEEQYQPGIKHRKTAAIGAAGVSMRRPVAAFSTRRPEPCWQCSPAGETGAAESLAAGAIHMLVFMVRRFRLLPLSDFSAETLNFAAEGSMNFEVGGTGAGTGVEAGSKAAAVRGVGQEGRPANGRAQRAGEALMLELFLSRGGGGIDILLPAVDSVRGLASLHERSAASVTRIVAGKGPVGGEEDTKNVVATGDSPSARLARGGENLVTGPAILGPTMLGSGNNRDRWWMAPGRRKNYAVAKLEVRQRLPILPPPVPTPRPSGPSVVGISVRKDVMAGKGPDHDVFSLSESTSSGLTLLDTSLSSADTCAVDLSQTSSSYAVRRKKGAAGGDKNGRVLQSTVAGGGGPGNKQDRYGLNRPDKHGLVRQEELAGKIRANPHAEKGKPLNTGAIKTSTTKGNRVFPLASSGSRFDNRKPKNEGTPSSPGEDSDTSRHRERSLDSHLGETTPDEDAPDSDSEIVLKKVERERVPWRVPKSSVRGGSDKETPKGDGQPKTEKTAKGGGWMSRLFRKGK